jgi:hypothetical protein
MIDMKSLECCGIKELIDIDDYRTEPEQIIEDVCEEYYIHEHRCAFYIFSDIQDKVAGKNLRKYILKNKLGTITMSPIRVNPNSDNSLRVYIWTISRANLRKYWYKNCRKDDELY